jgi:hypothetical protein
MLAMTSMGKQEDFPSDLEAGQNDSVKSEQCFDCSARKCCRACMPERGGLGPRRFLSLRMTVLVRHWKIIVSGWMLLGLLMSILVFFLLYTRALDLRETQFEEGCLERAQVRGPSSMQQESIAAACILLVSSTVKDICLHV